GTTPPPWVAPASATARPPRRPPAKRRGLPAPWAASGAMGRGRSLPAASQPRTAKPMNPETTPNRMTSRRVGWYRDTRTARFVPVDLPMAQWTGGDPCGIVPAMAKSPFSLEGRAAIVAGGGTGIGKSIAIEFARAGPDVALCSRKLEHLEPVVKAVRDVGKRSFAMALDVRQEEQMKAIVDRAVQEWGRLDIMVNNAGASFRAKPEDISVNGWNTVVGINLTGAFLGCKWAGRQMMQQPTGGVIVNISSIAGVYGSTMMPHYGAAKSAVITLTRELGTAWGRKGIRVNCIAPGP